MQIVTNQEFAASVESVAEAFRDPRLIDALDLPFVGKPSLVDRGTDGETVELAVRYEARLDLPTAARAFVDPDKLTFVEYSSLEPDGSGRFHVRPDHYPKLLQSSGLIELTETEAGCLRKVRTSLKVDLGWKGKVFRDQVEKIIARGFRDALLAQVGQVETFISESG